MTNLYLPDATLSVEALAAHLLPSSLIDQGPKLVPALAQSLLAVASLRPFNPNALVPNPNSWTSRDQGPLLAFLLARAPYEDQLPVMTAWPAEEAGFTPALAESRNRAKSERLIREKGEGCRGSVDAVDVEWLAAVLLAKGADPWVDRSADNPLGTPLARALEHDMSGLVVRMMGMEGAPSWSELASAPVKPKLASLRSHDSWLHAVAASREPRPQMLAMLLEKGGPVSVVSGQPHPLAKAWPWAVEVFAQAGRLPEVSAQKSVLSAWRSRLKSRELSVEEMTTMEMRLTSKSNENLEQVQMAALFAQELASPNWGTMMGRGSSHPEPHGLGAEDLVVRLGVEKGSLAGQWSRAAVQAVRYLRAFGGRGVTSWSFAQMGSNSGIHEVALESGALASARGFDWRPGQSIDGVFMLALYGMDVEEGDNLLRDYTKRKFNGNLEALGIKDGQAWGRAQLDSAIGFTEALVGRGTSKVNNRLVAIWGTVARRLPGVFDDQPEQLVRLMRCLMGTGAKPLIKVGTEKQQMTFDTHLEASEFLRHVLPKDWSVQSPPDFSSLDSAWAGMAAEVALLVGNPEWQDALVGGVGSLDKAARDRLQAWVKAQPTDVKPEEREFPVRVKMALMDATLEPAAPQARRPRM